MSRQGGVICGVVLDRAGCIVLHVSFFFTPHTKTICYGFEQTKTGSNGIKSFHCANIKADGWPFILFV